MNFYKELADLTETLRTQLPEFQKQRAKAREQMRKDRQCTGTTKKGNRCEASSVIGNPDKRCIRHGGEKTAVIPRKERFPACDCPAYSFPHRKGGGLCVHPEKPIRTHSTPRGQRRYYKRIRRKSKLGFDSF